MPHMPPDLIRASGRQRRLAINPATPVGALGGGRGRDRHGAVHDRQPGLGRAAVHRHSLAKIPRLRAIIGKDVALEVDGGIDLDTAPGCRQAGANVFVAGSAIFSEGDPGEAYLAIARAVDER